MKSEFHQKRVSDSEAVQKLRKTANLDSQGYPLQNSRTYHMANMTRDFELSNTASPDHHPRV